MKPILAILFSCLLFSLGIAQPAQKASNDVTEIELLLERLDANIASMKKNGQRKNLEPIFVPLKFHLVAETSGEGAADIEDILAELCALNNQFSGTDFQFYIDNGFNILNNTNAYENPRTTSARSVMTSQKNTAGRNALNIFITQNADAGSGNNGTVLGYYESRNDFIVIRKSQMGIGENTLAHEIGHYFSLAHPHLGWDATPWSEDSFGLRVTRTSVGGRRVELVDRSNCDVAGDRVCDTPPDYNFGLAWPSDCVDFDLGVTDRNGELIDPQQDNFMSYFLGCFPYQFTVEQTALMVEDYNSSERSSIRTSEMPTTETINDVAELLAPQNNATTDFYNGVELLWTKVQNATDYYVRIRGGGDDFRFVVQDTIMYVTVLNPNKTYTWSVQPFNESDGCTERRANLLKTNDLTTSVDDPVFIEQLQLVPNPAHAEDGMNLFLVSATSISGELSIFNIQGQLIDNESVRLKSGQNTLAIETKDLRTGLYVLYLRSDQGNITRKFIIE